MQVRNKRGVFQLYKDHGNRPGRFAIKIVYPTIGISSNLVPIRVAKRFF